MTMQLLMSFPQTNFLIEFYYIDVNITHKQMSC